jgi:hypothetical protein
MKLATHFVAYVDLEVPDAAIGIGHCCEPSSFDDALDAYADHRDNGFDAVLMRVDPPANGKAGMMTDVTADGDDALRRRLRGRGYDMPEWLMEPIAPCKLLLGADHAYDERKESA